MILDPSETFGQVAPVLAENGYRPIPVRPNTKIPIPMDWQLFEFHGDHTREFPNASTGILCGDIRAIDIDIREPSISDQVEKLAYDTLEIEHLAPRRVGLAPKRLLVVRADVSGEKITTPHYRLPGDLPDDKGHLVEILGAGQQFVAFGLHPDTKAPYSWNGSGSPLTRPIGTLPCVTHEQLRAFVAKAENLLARYGTRISKRFRDDNGEVHKSSEELKARDPEALRDALRHIPNDDIDRHDWMVMGMAIKGALGEEGLNDFLDWSAKSEKKFDEADARKNWVGFHPDNIGAGTIFYEAKRIGWTMPQQAPGDDLHGITARVWTVQELLDECVMLQDGAQVTFLERPYIALPFGTFKTLLAGSYDMVKTKNGEKRVYRADIWNQAQRKEVWGRTHAPGRDQVCEDPHGRLCVNLWRGIPHLPPTDWGERVIPFLEHVQYLIPIQVERDRFLDWLAHAEQQPGIRPHTHYLMRTRGTQGVGRNCMAEVLARVWRGSTALSVDLMGMLAGNFNGTIAGSLLGVVDELHVEQAGTSLRKLSQALKTEMTASIRNVRPKYGREYTEWCCTRWLMFSNHVAALPISEEDRRIIVIENPDKANTADYYSRLYAMLDNLDFISSVREFLRQRDVVNFNPGEHAPMNAAKSETIHATSSEWDLEAKVVAETWASDLILTIDLKSMVRDSEGQTPSGNVLRSIALDAGMFPVKTPVKFGDTAKRYWILRNADRWVNARSREITCELKIGRQAHTPDVENHKPLGPYMKYVPLR